MRFSLITAVFGMTSAVFAAPARRDWHDLLSLSQAEDIVTKFISVLEHYDVPAANATAQALFSDDYTERSDSILSLEGLPLGSNTFTGKQNYINGVLNAPPVEGIETIAVYVAGGEKILWQWRFTGIGTKEYPIKGFNLFTLNDAKQVSLIEVEFNSIAWGLDTGYQLIFPSGPPPSK